MTVFIRTRMSLDLVHASYYMASLFYTLIRIMTNGVAELDFTICRLPVFYKQRNFYLYPAWVYAVPASILKIPVALFESLLWTSITYYVIGYSPEASRSVNNEITKYNLILIIVCFKFPLIRLFIPRLGSSVSSFCYLRSIKYQYLCAVSLLQSFRP